MHIWQSVELECRIIYEMLRGSDVIGKRGATKLMFWKIGTIVLLLFFWRKC